MVIIPSLSRKQTFAATALVMALLAVLLWKFASAITPAPPRQIDMTTGAVDGASHQFAIKYQSYLKAHGVTLELQTSSGSVQNLERLNAGTPIGFVQGGLGLLALDAQSTDGVAPLRSLGVVGYEPVWMFASPALAKNLTKGLNGLAGKKVAIGGEGSGTRKVALQLLEAYGVADSNATLKADGGVAAAKALLAGAVDAVFFVGAPQTPAVQLLLAQPGQAALVSLGHAEGITRRLPYLSLVTLKAGSFDPATNKPPSDIALLATQANLVIRDDLHPALAYLLLQAAQEVHKGATLLNKPGEFPNGRVTDFPLADEATRYYRDGKPFLQRFLPYWAANAVQRLLLVLVPLLAIAVPVFRIVPKLFEFKEKNRLYKRYGVLLEIEHSIHARTLALADIADATGQLDKIEHDISQMKFALDFSDRVYTLRQHVDYVRRQLLVQEQKLLSASAGSTAASSATSSTPAG